jgi:hypothetical protein
LADKIRLEYSRAPGAIDPIKIPVGYADLHGDESEFGLKVSGGAAGAALGTPRTSSHTVTATAAPLVAENLTRKSLLIINNSPTDAVYIRGDGTATPDASSLKIAAGDNYSTDATGAAYSAVAAAGKTVSVTVEEIATSWPA